MPTTIKNITTQKQLDALKEVKEGQTVYIKAALRLPGILTVRGSLIIEKNLDTDWYEDRYVEAWDSATVEAWDSATVRAWDSATVRASGSATVRASDSAILS